MGAPFLVSAFEKRLMTEFGKNFFEHGLRSRKPDASERRPTVAIRSRALPREIDNPALAGVSTGV